MSQNPTKPSKKRRTVYLLVGIPLALLAGQHLELATLSLLAFNTGLLLLAALLALPRCASFID